MVIDAGHDLDLGAAGKIAASTVPVVTAPMAGRCERKVPGLASGLVCGLAMSLTPARPWMDNRCVAPKEILRIARGLLDFARYEVARAVNIQR